MKTIVIQPPLVQLNTAYPSGAYLVSFFRSLSVESKWFDLSIELFHRIFCAEGLKRLFELTADRALQLADKALDEGNETAAENLRRYISQKDAWIEWIDTITSVLADGSPRSSREACHKFVFSPHVPRGMRTERRLSQLDRMPSTDDARFLASMELADLADYITAVFDSGFSLVRYGESVTISEAAFDSIEKGADAPVLKEFYAPLLKEKFGPQSSVYEKIRNSEEKCLVCISVPFAGTFAAALHTGRFFKDTFGDKVFVFFGGGFVNTELRDCREKALLRYTDAICYDRGYGSYKAFIDEGFCSRDYDKTPLYKIRIFAKEKDGTTSVIDPVEHDTKAEQYENEMTASVMPDFSDINTSNYPRMIDDVNPMQRMWSDGTWLKAYMAHGCYWHKCAFCDVNLDYVSGYRMTCTDRLFDSLNTQAQKHGVYGIHFVDEAMPPVSMKRFAHLNAAQGNSLSWWGNVRFEKVYNRDTADFLSFGGLTGVSGGIEIATGKGLDHIHKGTDIDSIVGACCAFKEAGILVHAYMIYGYWQESDQDTIDSMETLRQFFEAGLLDSCFWHKFTLTRHSRIYSEYKQGLYPELKVIEDKSAGIFARNGLHFRGEKNSEKFRGALNFALESWMHGEGLEKRVNKWFDFATPKPTVPLDYIKKAIERYEQKRDAAYNAPLNPQKNFWLGGTITPCCHNRYLEWYYMGEPFRIECTALKGFGTVQKLNGLLCSLSPRNKNDESVKELQEAIKNPAAKRLMQSLRGRGLVQI